MTKKALKNAKDGDVDGRTGNNLQFDDDLTWYHSRQNGFKKKTTELNESSKRFELRKN